MVVDDDHSTLGTVTRHVSSAAEESIGIQPDDIRIACLIQYGREPDAEDFHRRLIEPVSTLGWPARHFLKAKTD